ncbi:MAG: hypothetical protein ACJ8F1_18170, partial [Polyangia bacterium]
MRNRQSSAAPFAIEADQVQPSEVSNCDRQSPAWPQPQGPSGLPAQGNAMQNCPTSAHAASGSHVLQAWSPAQLPVHWDALHAPVATDHWPAVQMASVR